MNTILVLVVIAILATLTAIRANKKKAEAKAAVAAAALAAKELAEWTSSIEEIGWVLSHLTLSGIADLAYKADIRTLQSAVYQKTAVNPRVGRVFSTSLANHDGLGLYIDVDGKTTCFGLLVVQNMYGVKTLHLVKNVGAEYGN